MALCSIFFPCTTLARPTDSPFARPWACQYSACPTSHLTLSAEHSPFNILILGCGKLLTINQLGLKHAKFAILPILSVQPVISMVRQATRMMLKKEKVLTIILDFTMNKKIQDQKCGNSDYTVTMVTGCIYLSSFRCFSSSFFLGKHSV